MWKIRLQQKTTKEGDVVDVKVKAVYRPTFDDATTSDDPDEPTGFAPVCRQMLLEYTDKLGNKTVHKVKHFAGTDKEIVERYFNGVQVVEHKRVVNNGGFIYQYQDAVQLDYKGRKVVKEKTIVQKESRMSAAAFEQFLITKHGKDMAAEIMGAFSN